MQCITRCILLYSFAYCVLYKIRQRWGTKAKMFNGWSSIQNTMGHIYLHVLFFTLLTWLLGQSEWLSVCRFQRESALTVTFIPGQAYFKKKKITNVFLCKGETHRKVFALSCCCIVSGHFVALFALKNQHQNLSLTITQSRSLDHGHLHCSMAPLRHWAYLFIDTHTHARTQT